VINGIPRLPLVLGLLGTLPFIGGAILTAFPEIASTHLGLPFLMSSLIGQLLLTTYSTVILCFMSGALWGFASRADEPPAWSYISSVIPALLIFFWGLFQFVGTASGAMSATLLPYMVLFAALLILDYLFWRSGLAPDWWMKLRLIITVIVLFFLMIGQASL